jgi:hypothetical protein
VKVVRVEKVPPTFKSSIVPKLAMLEKIPGNSGEERKISDNVDG